MTKQKIMGIRKFRETFPSETEEPVTVIRAKGGVEIIGYWLPSSYMTDGLLQDIASYAVESDTDDEQKQ